MEIRAPVVFAVTMRRQPIRGDCLNHDGQLVEVVESVALEPLAGSNEPRWAVSAVRPRVLY
ncbi:MAG TPA: hypothetical protein VFH70_08730 [Acidimicrobiales bacterium]|nr:hypothetical protein [Acidimicrobiales bacterium]